MNRAAHWNKVYAEKAAAELSWFQQDPTSSLELIDRLALPLDGAVIDVGGGGPSALVGRLLDRGFHDISILDVAAAALQRCREQLADRADRIIWIEADITRFIPSRRYDLWHDRAVFHFLIDPADRQAYIDAMVRGIAPGGHAVIAAFAPEGPTKCSGLDVARWDPPTLAQTLGDDFALIAHAREIHRTPWGKPQSFVYCLFQRLENRLPEPKPG